MTQRRTANLLQAALMRSLGATILSVEPGPDGKGEVTLDVSRVTPARVASEADCLAEQLRLLPASP